MKQDKKLDKDVVDFGASVQAWKELWRMNSPQSQYCLVARGPTFIPPTSVSPWLQVVLERSIVILKASLGRGSS